MSDVVGAIDVGGTRIKAALVDRNGTEVVASTTATPADCSAPGTLVTAAAAVVTDLIARARASQDGAVHLVACGIVVPGIVNEDKGIATYAANLGFRDLPVAGPLGEALEVPTRLGHDVRAGLVAEVRWGAGRGGRNVLFMPLGTGIAGALMIDGQVLTADGWSGELGHVVVVPDGLPCGCGGRGHLETVGSAAAIARAYAASRDQTGRAAAADPPTVTAELVANLVAAGDPVAIAVWDNAIAALADGIVAAVTMTGVQTVIVGGGLSLSGDTLLAPLRTAVADRLSFQRPPHLVGAALGDRAGALGAAAYAWDLT